MNYESVLNKYSSNGNSLIETYIAKFDDNGNPVDKNQNYSLKASASLIQAVYEDVKNLDVSEFGNYVDGFISYICELIKTKGTDKDAKSIDKMACMPLVCLDTVCGLYGSDFTKKVNDGFKDMFMNFPKRSYEDLCNCYNTLTYYVGLFSKVEHNYNIDVPVVAEYLIGVGDIMYADYVCKVEGFDWDSVRRDLVEMSNPNFCN